MIPDQYGRRRRNRGAWGPVLLFSLAAALGAVRASAEQMTLEEQQAEIEAGVRLHEKGDFEGALAKYREVLAANPKNVTALYESSFTYAFQKQWQACYETAKKALRLESSIRSQIFALAGSCYDAGGEPKKAIAVIKRGLREDSGDAGLWFNLAVVYDRLGDISEVESALERAVKVQPEHLSGNYALGVLYARTGRRIPALLANLRYLSLDSESERAGQVARSVKDLVLKGVTPEGSGGNVTINLSETAGKGPFGSSDLMLSIVAAGRYLPEFKDQGDLQWLAGVLDSLLGSMSELKPGQGGKCFPCGQYGGFFDALKEKSLVQPFTYLALQSLDPKGSADWRAANAAKVAELKAWLGEPELAKLKKIG